RGGIAVRGGDGSVRLLRPDLREGGRRRGGGRRARRRDDRQSVPPAGNTRIARRGGLVVAKVARPRAAGRAQLTGIPTRSMAWRNASTTAGENCVPAPSRSSSRARSGPIAGRYTRSLIIAS